MDCGIPPGALNPLPRGEGKAAGAADAVEAGALKKSKSANRSELLCEEGAPDKTAEEAAGRATGELVVVIVCCWWVSWCDDAVASEPFVTGSRSAGMVPGSAYHLCG